MIEYKINDIGIEDDISSYLQQFSNMYEDIGKWWEEKCYPDWCSFSRDVIIVKEDEKIIGLSISKPKSQYLVKLCHMSIDSSYQKQGIGNQLLKICSRLYIPNINLYATCPESVYETNKTFLEDHNLTPIKEVRLYRPEEKELILSPKGIKQ